MTENSKILDRLYKVIESRKGNNPASSYTAHLLSQGMPEIARKVGEEAIETITAALTEEQKHCRGERGPVVSPAGFVVRERHHARRGVGRAR